MEETKSLQLLLDKKIKHREFIWTQYDELMGRLGNDPSLMSMWIKAAEVLDDLDSEISTLRYAIDRERFLLPPKEPVTEKMAELRDKLSPENIETATLGDLNACVKEWCSE